MSGFCNLHLWCCTLPRAGRNIDAQSEKEQGILSPVLLICSLCLYYETVNNKDSDHNRCNISHRDVCCLLSLCVTVCVCVAFLGVTKGGFAYSCNILQIEVKFANITVTKLVGQFFNLPYKFAVLYTMN